MAERQVKKKATTGRAVAKPKVEAEHVPASELNVGDDLFFPNSRGAQEIESIVDDEETGVRAITAGTTVWHCASDFEVKRVKK